MKTRASKIGSVLLTLSLIIGMFAGMGLTAWAAEPEPVADYDYLTEMLIDLVAGADYTVNGAAFTASNPDATIPIDENWFGSTVLIVKKGTLPADDSTAQSLAIPARDPAPTGFIATPETAVGSGGTITGADVTMQRSTAATGPWVAYAAGDFSNLAAGTYYIRVAATTTAFASEAASVTVGSYVAPGTDNYEITDCSSGTTPPKGEKFEKLQDALDYLTGEGETSATIQVLKPNLTETGPITITDMAITIDLFGRNLTLNDDVSLTTTGTSTGLTVTDTGPTAGSAGPGTLKINGNVDAASGCAINVAGGGLVLTGVLGVFSIDLVDGTLDLTGATGTVSSLSLSGGTLVVTGAPPWNTTTQLRTSDLQSYLNTEFPDLVITLLQPVGTPVVTLGRFGTLTAGTDYQWIYTPFPDPKPDTPTPRTTTTTRSNSSNLETYALFYYKNPTNDFFIYCQDGYLKGDKVKITNNVPTRSGYTFLYWTTDPGGDGTHYNAGDIFYLNGNAELYAQWSPRATDREPYDDDGPSFNPSTGR